MSFSIQNVKPVSSLVQRFGVKVVLYGGPGTGKTPMCTTAPNPIIAFSEPGLLSVRGWNGPGVECYTYKAMREFWMWAIQSQEARQFETFCADSISQMAEIILAEELADPKMKDPRKAYGNLSQKMMELLNWIYFAPGLNALLVAKEMVLEVEGQKKYRPYFPGQDLGIKVPHLFDSVWRVEITQGQNTKMIRTRESYNAFARDRSGLLAELEPTNIAQLFAKSRQ